MMGANISTLSSPDNCGPLNANSGPATFDAWMQGVSKEFETVAGMSDKMPYSAPLARAVLINFETTDDGERLMHILHHANPERPAPEAYRLVRSAYVAQMRHRKEPRFPDGYTTVDECLRGVRWAQTTFPYANRLNEILRNFNLSTTIWQRYNVMRFLGPLMMHRTGSERIRGDIGCSDFTGSKAVVLSDMDSKFRFDPVDVLEEKGRLWVPSKDKSDLFEEIAAQPDQASRTIGVDRVDPTDPIVADFIEGSLTPEEIKDGALPTRHDKLLRARVPEGKLKFVQADIARQSGVKKVLEEAGGLLDEAYMILAWHQGGARKRRATFGNLGRLVSLEKPVVIVDFARRDTNGDKPYLSVLSDWTKGLNVFVQIDGELYRPLQWTDGRCRAVKICPDLAKVAKGGPYEKQVRELLA
ncbi:MAG TPA: hypothetical protein VIS56_00370 [Candidatus Saccharimonadales bacterium]